MPSGRFDWLLEDLQAERAAEAASVHHFMQRPVVACRAGSTVRDALQLMFEHDVGFLPVVDEQDRVVGIVTDRDLARVVYRADLPPGAIGLTDVATTPVHVVQTDDPLTLASARMEKHRVHRLPVVDKDGKLVGVLSLDDLARAVADGPLRRAAEITAAYASMVTRPH